MKKMFVTMVFCVCMGAMLSPLVIGETVVVDDHFDDGDVSTNTTGIGSGFNFWDIDWDATVTEADSTITLNGPTHGGSRCSTTSIEGAAIGSGISRFEFRGVSFAVGNTGSGSTARDCIGVKEGNETWDFDEGLPTGFWIQFENDSLCTADGSGGWNGTSVLFYEAADDTKTVLASWEFDTLNWDSGAQELTPALDITLDLEADGYSLTIEGDSVTLLSGSLSNSYAAAGITNELTVGYVTSYIQSENPGIDISIDRIIMTEDAVSDSIRPYDPMAIPQNEDGSVGTVTIPALTVTDVDLMFKAGKDPNFAENGLLVNPDIQQFNIYFQTGAPTDPNLYLIDAIGSGSSTDPNRLFPLSAYNPGAGVLEQGTLYKWQVEQVMMNPETSMAYGAGDPNNIYGTVWSFTTASAVPSVMIDPDHTIADVSGNAALTIAATATGDNFRWYKVVGEQDSPENGETDDIELSDSGIYSGATTATLTITGLASNGSEDGQFYAIAYNGVPGEPLTVESTPSATAWVWFPRLVNYYTFESEDVTVVDGNSIAIDNISSYDMTMLSNDQGSDVPAIEPNVPAALGIPANDTSLKLDNPRISEPNNVDAQYAQVFNEWAGSYLDITISAWVYSNGGSNWNRILDFGNDNANYMFICVNPGSVNGAVRFAVNVGGSEQSVTSPEGVLPDHEWTFVTATLTSDTGRLYINGELVATSTSLTNDPISYGPTSQNWIGRSQWGGGDGYFNGMIDELKIYNYGLKTVEIGKDYLADSQEAYVCNFEADELPYDYNGNCLVDLGDLAVFAVSWLESNRILPD